MPLESSTEAYEQAHRTRNVDSEESDEAVPAEVLPSLPFLRVRLLFRGIKVAAEFLELTEKPLHDGLKRIRWTCVCGCSLYDDFKEFAPGALDELQNLLNNGENTDVINLHEEADRTDNSTDAAHDAARTSQRRPKVAPVRQATGSTSIHNDPRSTKGLAKSSTQSSQSIQSRNDRINRNQAEGNNNNSPQGLRQRHPTRSETGTSAMGYNAWVLPIFQYDRYGTRVKHLRVDQTTSDKDLFVNIKEKYHQETSKVRRFFVMRGVKKISCVKFVHAAIEPDIHKFDDWPRQKHSPPWIYKGCPAKKSHIPLVGHTYLMHLWQHPSHCDRQTYKSHRQTSIARLFRQLGFRRGGFGTSGMLGNDPDAPGNASRHDTELAGMNSSTSNGNRALDGRDSSGPRSSYVLLRIPKKLGEQLTATDEDPPEAWGLYFEEGFGVHHFLLIILMMYAMASLGFAIYWCERYGLVGPNSGSGAFAVASWMCVIAAMMSDIGEYRKLLRPTVPMRGLFLPAEKFVRVDNGIDCSNPNVSPEWRHHLNESQCQAIGMACTNMFSIVRGPAATGGDHKQLPAFVHSTVAKKLWPSLFFTDYIKLKKVDYSLLDTQYRGRSLLNAAANDIIYDGKVNAFHKTAVPRLSCLTSWSNFVDVPHGVQQSKIRGGSCNDVSDEVQVVEAMIRALLALSKPLDSMAVVTGCLWQLEKLQKMKAKNAWADLRLLSADTCEGGGWDIAIIRLVKTENSPGFIGDELRANAAVTRAREARYIFCRETGQSCGIGSRIIECPDMRR
ncbi:MAG: hypothetical protein LQ343_007411 [Gyalolechia ehrenbergii]|nr:MAG: hypothetical protein LQ343_007411 [Gyalolechia ehrenbergii]